MTFKEYEIKTKDTPSTKKKEKKKKETEGEKGQIYFQQNSGAM